MVTTTVKHAVPGWGTRLVVAVTALILIVTPPSAFVCGVVEWLALRKRRPFLAYHGLLTAGFQLAIVLLTCLVGLAIRFSRTGDALDRILSMFLQLSPREIVGTFPNVWHSFSLPECAAVLTVLAILLVNILVALIGAVVALCGRVYRLPLLGRLCARITPPV